MEIGGVGPFCTPYHLYPLRSVTARESWKRVWVMIPFCTPYHLYPRGSVSARESWKGMWPILPLLHSLSPLSPSLSVY